MFACPDEDRSTAIETCRQILNLCIVILSHAHAIPAWLERRIEVNEESTSFGYCVHDLSPAMPDPKVG